MSTPYPVLAIALIHMVENISERRRAAGWHHDIEYRLWATIHGGENSEQLTDAEIRSMQALRFIISGWVRYGDDGPEYVTTEQWTDLYNAWEPAA